MRSLCCFIVLISFLSIAKSQSIDKATIIESSEKEFYSILQTYKKFLSIENEGSSIDNIRANLIFCDSILSKLGFNTEVLMSDTIPHLFAEKVISKKKKTVMFYLQIDGQPVDSAMWDQSNPFVPALKKQTDNSWTEISWEQLDSEIDLDWRVFARSSSDSKGPALSFLSSLAILNKLSVKPDYNIKVILDFQEEKGSPTLPGLVKREQDKFEADMLVIMDGTRHLSNLPTLTFGARGIATMTLTVYGAKESLHSGQYGNFSPNPVFKMSRLLSSMKEESGKVLIRGFYDGIKLTAEDQKIFNDVPEDINQINTWLGIAEAEQVGSSYQESLAYPSLNVRGLNAAWVGKEVRTIIPNKVIAEIDMRLVPETPAERQIDLVKDHIQMQGFKIVSHEPTDEERSIYPNIIKLETRIGSRPFRTPINSELGDWLEKSMTRLFDKDGFIKMRTTGGSQPIAPFITTLNIPAVSVRIPNPDNNIHGPNENLRLGNFLEGIQMCMAILTQELD